MAFAEALNKPAETIPYQKIICIGLVLAVFLCPAKAWCQAKPKTPETIRELQTAIEKVLKETGTPAAGIALVKEDSTVWVAGLGTSDLENGIKANENTMFRIGSVSKMFVSLAILKLQQEGRVSLKDKVHDLAPEIAFNNPWEDIAPVLVENLLEHTTGWDDMHLADYALNDPKLTLKQGLDFHPHSRTSRWMPGTRMAYSNSGPPVAAFLIEKITGQAFEKYVQTNFFQPIGMESATYFASEKYRQLGAKLYLDKKPQPYWNISVRPSGAINASPKDMAQMLLFFVGRGKVNGMQIVSEVSLQRMEKPSTSTGAKAGLEYGYGLANQTSPYKSWVYRSHGGAVNGGLSDFSYLPSHKVGYVAMVNSGDMNALNRITRLIREFQTRHFSTEKVNLASTDSLAGPDIKGYYVAINPRIAMTYPFERVVSVKEIWAKKSTVFIQGLLGGWVETHRAIGHSRYVSPETGKISLVEVIDPLAGKVLHAGSQVLRRVTPLVVFSQLILGSAWILYCVGSALFGIICFILLMRGKRFTKSSVRIGLLPILASFFVIMEFLLEYVGGMDPIERLGKMSFTSVAIMVVTICFALAAIGSVGTIIIQRNTGTSKNTYWQLAVLSGLHFLVACYLLWFGMIGIQTWR